MDGGRSSSPKPEPFHDETGEIERVIKRYIHVHTYVDNTQ